MKEFKNSVNEEVEPQTETSRKGAQGDAVDSVSLSGRELDAAVAQRVMGWSAHTYAAHNGDNKWLNSPANYPHVEITDDPEPYTGLLLWRDSVCDGIYWSPSIDIAAAMEVVAKVDANTFLLKRFGGTVEDAVVWNAEFMSPDAIACAFTAPEAICRAALSLVSVPDTNTSASERPSS